MRDLKEFCTNNRADLHPDNSSTDSHSIARAVKDAQKYQHAIPAQPLELQAACSHTAQNISKGFNIGGKEWNRPNISKVFNTGGKE